MSNTARLPLRQRHLLALEPRFLLDAAVTATAAEVVAATATGPGIGAQGAAATIALNDSTGAETVDLFSNVSVANDAAGQDLTNLVITIDSAGTNQALVIDGTEIKLTAGDGSTAGNAFFYKVTVSGNSATVTVNIESSPTAFNAAGAAAMIDSIAYRTLDNSVLAGTRTVTLATLGDSGGEEVALGIDSSIVVSNSRNVAPVLNDERGLTPAEHFSGTELGGATEVVYSADGKFAYAAGQNGAVSAYAVDGSGRLGLLQTLSGFAALGSVSDLVISADGRSLYLSSDEGSSVAHLRAGSDGRLSYAGSYQTDNGETSGGMAISPDGAYVYVGTQWNDIVIYSRNADNGALTVIGRAPGESFSNSRHGVMATSGEFVYALYSGIAHSLLVYQRDSEGQLHTVAALITAGSGFAAVDYRMAVSGDGRFVYVANPDTGELAVYQVAGDSISLRETLSVAGLSSIALSRDGSQAYATTGDGGVAVYAVAADGRLSLASRIATDGNGSDIAVSADGRSVLVAGGSVGRYTAVQNLDRGTALAFGDALGLHDSNYDVLADGAGNYMDASLRITASVAGGSFGFIGGQGLSLVDGTLMQNGQAIGNMVIDGTTLTVRFTAAVDTATANRVLHQLSYRNDSAAAGSFITLSAVASDASLASTALSLVLRVNTAPQLDRAAATGYMLNAATSETAYRFTLYQGLFTDADGDPLTWAVSGLPPGLSFDAATRTISGAASQTGRFALVVTSTDASGGSASLNLELVVGQIANRAPEANLATSTVLSPATVDRSYSLTLDEALFNDADRIYGDTLSWQVSGLPDGLRFDATTRTLSGTGTVTGSSTLTVTVTDRLGASASSALTLRVITPAEADNTAPVLRAEDSAMVYTPGGLLSGYSYYVGDLSLSADGTLLAVLGTTSTNFGGTAYVDLYARDTTTGALTLIQRFSQGAADDGNAANGLEIDGLSGSAALLSTADGRTVYLSGGTVGGAQVLLTMRRDADTGQYSVTERTAMAAKVIKLELSSDGDTLYAMTATSLSAFAVDGTGALATPVDFTGRFSGAISLAVDGRGTVYVLTGTGNIAVFSTGSDGTLAAAGLLSRSGTALTWTPEGGSASSAGTLGATAELNGTNASLAVSDQGFVYVVTASNARLTILQRDHDANTLRFVGSGNPSANLGNGSPWAVAVSADGSALYVGANGGQLAVYNIGNGATPVLINVLSLGRPITKIETSADSSVLYTGARFFNTGLTTTTSSDSIVLSYNERGTVQPATSVSLSDTDYDALAGGNGNYKGAVITMVRAGGANPVDSFGFVDGNGLSLVDGVIALNGVAIATMERSGGQVSVRFTGDASTEVATQVLRQISYSNSSDTPGSRIQLQIGVGDAYATTRVEATLQVNEINNAPTLQASGQDVVFVSGASPVKLFTDVRMSAAEDSQRITGLQFTVTGVVDGEQEALQIADAIALRLIDGARIGGSVAVETTESDGSVSVAYIFFEARVSVTGGVATVTVRSDYGLPAATFQAVLAGMGYLHRGDSPTAGTRHITLVSVSDSGGTALGGVDTTALSVAASVGVSLRNTAPSVDATPARAVFTEGGSPTVLFGDVSLATGEAGQAIVQLTLTVSGLVDGTNETLRIGGSTVALVEGFGKTASGVDYSIAFSDGTATVTLTRDGQMSAAEATALLAGLAYAHLGDDPSAGTRSIALTSVQDDGGQSNGGSDTARPGLNATVDVQPVNDAPLLSAQVVRGLYADTSQSTRLFSSTVLSTVEAGQTIASVRIGVSGLANGRDEILRIDGTAIALVAGSGSTAGGHAYSVSVDAASGLATVTVQLAAGTDSLAAAALIDGIAYANLSAAFIAGERSFSLSVQDSGGGTDSRTLDGTATLTLVDNTAPQFGSTPERQTLELLDRMADVAGLSDIVASTLAGDGRFVYAVASDGRIALLSRDAGSGELQRLGTLDSGLAGVLDLQLSADGQRLFVLGADGDAIRIFNRSAQDGSLTADGGLATENVVDFSVSADGSAIYVVDGNYAGLTVYSRDAATGAYALSQHLAADPNAEPHLFTGVGIQAVGDRVYVITRPSSDDLADTLIVYQRQSDGTLRPLAFLRDGDSDGAGGTVRLDGALDLAVSADGSRIYVAGAAGVSGFSLADGTLSALGRIDGQPGVSALALSGDADTLYLVAADGTLVRYDLGGTSPVQLTLDGVAPPALAGASGLTVTAGGALVVSGSGGLLSLRDALTGAQTVAYTERDTVLLAPALRLSDAEHDALANGAGNYLGAVLTVVRSGGANAADGFGLAAGQGLSLLDGQVLRDGVAIASFASVDGSLTLRFTAAVSTTVANQVLQQISYRNGSDAPGSSATLAMSLRDAAGAIATVELLLQIAEINDAPTVGAVGTNAPYLEGQAPAALFTQVSLTTVEPGQNVIALDFVVTGVADGASETLQLDGTAIALVEGSGTTAGGHGYSVARSGGSLTVTLSLGAGLDAERAAALIATAAYAHSSDAPSAGVRGVTLSRVQDSGGNDNGGSDSVSPAVTANLDVRPVNDAPVAGSTGATVRYVEGQADGAVLFSATRLATVEAGQTIVRIGFTLTGVADGASETLQLDGTAIALVEGSGTTAGGHGYSVARSGGGLTVTLSLGAGLDAERAAALIDTARYANASTDPTAGSRSITLALVQDSGGSANGGQDTARPNVGASVTVEPVNNPPLLSSSPATLAIDAGTQTGPLFSGSAIDTVEPGQAVAALSLRVGGVLNAGEQLIVDGSVIALVDGSGTTASGHRYTVVVDGGTATVSLTLGAAGLPAAQAAALIDGIAYRHAGSSVSVGDRSITLLGLHDTGGGNDSVRVDLGASVTVREAAPPAVVAAPGVAPADVVYVPPTTGWFIDADGETPRAPVLPFVPAASVVPDRIGTAPADPDLPTAPATATTLLDLLLPPSDPEADREALALRFEDGQSTLLVSVALDDGPALQAAVRDVRGAWVYDIAGNRLVLQLPKGLFASRVPVASLSLQGVDGRALPTGIRLDLASGSIIAPGGRAAAQELQLVLRTADGRSLVIPVHIEASRNTAWLPRRSDSQDTAQAPHDGKPALTLQLRAGPAGDLRGEALALLQQLQPTDGGSPLSIASHAAR